MILLFVILLFVKNAFYHQKFPRYRLPYGNLAIFVTCDFDRMRGFGYPMGDKLIES